MRLKKIGVQFVPSAEFPMEDVRSFNELDFSLMEGKKIAWKHPFDHFHVNGVQPTGKNMSQDEIIGHENMGFQYIEGPIPFTLLGTEFEIYSLTEMVNFVVSDIEWDDDSKQSGEVYINDVPGKIWELRRQYMTKEDVEKNRLRKKRV